MLIWLMATCFACLAQEGPVRPALRISIFANHVDEIARQEGISFDEAARRVKVLGYEGVDVMGQSPEQVAALVAAGFRISCVIGFTAFEKGYDEAQCSRLIATACSNGCRRVMLVPGFYPDGCDRTAVRQTIVARTRRFAAAAARQGIETVVEDFDDERSPTYGIDRVRSFLADAPEVGFVYDTGNFVNPKGRPEDGLQLLGRTRHFHLKDRSAGEGAQSVAVGTGVIPILPILGIARKAGYSDWVSVEHFGVTNMLDCAALSIRNLCTL